MTNDRSQLLASSQTNSGAPGRGLLWTGRVLSALGVLFMTMDASMKVLQLPVAVQGTTQLGYPASVILPLGLLQVACLILYLVPRTAVFGAILWTGYLGGAVATHVRVQNPWFSHILFPVYVALLFWVGLTLRMPALRALLFPQQPSNP